ncbi:hypothetical protein ACJJTC_011888 [Scirpophaga incertulas]
MRIKNVSENGNVLSIHRNENISNRNINSRNWNLRSNHENDRHCAIIYQKAQSLNTLNTNYNYELLDSNGLDENNEITEHNGFRHAGNIDNADVCNRQYRINTQASKSVLSNIQHSKGLSLSGNTITAITTSESFKGNTNVYSSTLLREADRTFEQTDTDEMSDNGIQNLPRGIVNPNYPGFQHLAHTLQDYSSTIDNFYPSENDTTDDDIDIEITELSECENSHNEDSTKYTNINNNNNELISSSDCTVTRNDIYFKSKILDSHIENDDVPDLIKTVSKNNNNNNIEYSDCDLNCVDTDIENNFNTKDIIGDFNKEIEDEIKLLLNYNINIQDDLEELRKDIKDSFAKPIENTINNISDVVNHVIKKLVETQTEHIEQSEDFSLDRDNYDQNVNFTDNENIRNTKIEMTLSRPTFLFIENKTSSSIIDAHLSDGKDEINIYDNEFDNENQTNNVENTIKQLSTEIRKIIPKLDEMRERDKLWSVTRPDISIVTDRNLNEVDMSSVATVTSVATDNLKRDLEACKSLKSDDTDSSLCVNETNCEIKAPEVRDKISPQTTLAQSNTSVQKASAKDYDLGSFDVYNIETALPKLDLDAIENHLKAAKEAERRKRNDREEIRKRLAMGGDYDEYYSLGYTDRPGKKPSLHSRLQNGKNLQICFMNETASDNESQSSDLERNFSSNRSSSRSSLFNKSSYNNHPYQTRPLSVSISKQDKINTIQIGAKLRPTSLSMKSKSRSSHSLGHIELKESDFYALQATLQTEARIALAQAKEMARIQMERERRSRPVSPVTEMLRRSMEKANAPLAADRRRVSRQLLTDMNIAQLQVIVNELHSQIESLNDSLVKMLMARDELHMGQDSMLVDIEDLTRYLGVKEQSKKTKGAKSGVKRLTSLVHK